MFIILQKEVSELMNGLSITITEVQDMVTLFIFGLEFNQTKNIMQNVKAPTQLRQSVFGDANEQSTGNIATNEHDVITGEISAQDRFEISNILLSPSFLYFLTLIHILSRRELKSDTFHFDAQRMIGHGSFGAVFLAKVVETDEMVAIKKVLQDKRFKNRELQIMRLLVAQPHPYIVALKQHFVTKGNKNDDQYLNLVLEFIPETIYSVAKYFIKRKESMPIFSVKIYMYQLARSLAHIHGMGICHR